MDEFMSMNNWGQGRPNAQFNLNDINDTILKTLMPNTGSPVPNMLQYGAPYSAPGMPSGGWGGGAPTPGAPWKTSNFWLGGTDDNGNQSIGAAMPMLQGANTLMEGFMGMKKYGLARDTFNQNKREFEMNHGNQVRTTNAQLEDRQRARVASNPGAYQSVDEYMAKHGVK